MDETRLTPPHPGRRNLLIVALLAALVFLPGLGRRDLWNPDEARYAEVAREMRDAGSWSVPRLNGEVYTQKPPLLFWAILGSGALRGGIDETAARLPSALSAIGALLAVFAIGHRLFGRRAAWLAVLAFGTCFKILWQGRFGQIDMLLTFLVTLAVWFWLRGWSERRPGLTLLFYVFAGIATLAKGPVGLLPPLLSILAFHALDRTPGGKGAIRRLRLPLGLLVYAAIVLAWLIPAAISGGAAYLEQIAFKQTVTRYADPWHHFEPWYYYLTVLPANFFPWSLFLPTGIFVAWKRATGEERRSFLFCACWIVVTLLFFSFSRGKRDVYILSMFPALALLVGGALDRLATDWPRDRRWLYLPFGMIGFLFLLVLAALPIAGPKRPELAALGGEPVLWGTALLLLPPLAGALWGFWAGRKGRSEGAARALAGGMALTALLASYWLLPRLDVLKSARGLSRILVAQIRPGETYGIYPRLDSTVVFYTGRFAVDLNSPDKLRAFVSGKGATNGTGRIWLLAQRDDYAKIVGTLPPRQPPLREVARDADPKSGYLLLTRP